MTHPLSSSSSFFSNLSCYACDSCIAQPEANFEQSHCFSFPHKNRKSNNYFSFCATELCAFFKGTGMCCSIPLLFSCMGSVIFPLHAKPQSSPPTLSTPHSHPNPKRRRMHASTCDPITLFPPLLFQVLFHVYQIPFRSIQVSLGHTLLGRGHQ